MPSPPTVGSVFTDDDRGPLAVVVILLVVVAIIGGTVVWSVSLEDQRDDLLVLAHGATVVQVAGGISQAGMAEQNAVLLASLREPDGSEPVGAAITRTGQARADAVRLGAGRLEPLVDDGPIGATAESLLTILEDFPDDSTEMVSPDDVSDLTGSAIGVVETLVTAYPDLLWVLQLVQHATLPHGVLNDAIDVEYLAVGRAAGWSDGYFDGSASYLATGDTGWLSGDVQQPLPSPWFTFEELESERPDTWDVLTSLFLSTDAIPLATFDAWVTEWPSRTTDEAPVTVDKLVEAGAAVSVELDALVLAEVGGFIAAREAAAQATARRRTVLLVAAGILLVILLCVAFRLGRTQWSRLTGWRRDALVDQLTGSLNRRGLQEHITAHAAKADAHAVLLFDLDHFKGINDSYGHATGDVALCTVVAAARDVAEQMTCETVVCRVGGDEFVLFCHGMQNAVAQAAEAADWLMQGIGRRPVPTDAEPVFLSLSLGIASATGPPDLDDLLMKADIALYEVKRTGRGAHRAYTPSHEPPVGQVEQLDRQP